MTQLQGQVALLTGGSAPLAHELAVALAQHGVRVAVCGPVAERLESVCEAVRAAGGECLPLVTELNTLAEAEAVVSQTLTTFGRLDLLVFVTPFWNGGLIHEHAIATWDLVLAANLRVPFVMARAVLPFLREQRHGQVLAIGSDSGLGHYARDGAFGVAMHALNALMEQIRLENAECGIRVHVLAPGLTQTQATDADGQPNLTASDVVDWALWLLQQPAHLRRTGPVLL